MSLRWPPKDKDETLDYSLDWSRALETNDTIQAVSWFVVDSTDTKTLLGLGDTVDTLRNLTQSNTTTVATIYLEGGTDNKEYKLVCRVTTAAGRVKERSVKIRIREYN